LICTGVRFILKLQQHLLDLGACFAIGADKVCQDHAHVAQLRLGHGFEQVRERGRRDLGEIRVANGGRLRVVEIWRKFVEENERRLALEEIDPCAATRGLQRLVVVLE
jgi:hypothetical protein